VPTRADLSALWHCVERVLVTLSPGEQLRLGGYVIDQLADLHQAKANALLSAWETHYDPQDPQLAEDWLRGLVRQSQYVDVSELTAPPRRRSRRPPTEGDSIAATVPKAQVLDWIDQQHPEAAPTTAAQAIALAHAENVGAWVDTLQQWFSHHPQPIPLLQLQGQLGWPLVQLWLTLLLGNFTLQPIGKDFYDPEILVSAAGLD
jgi:hypothetical protein